MLILFHRTTEASAQKILTDGFRDATGVSMTDREHTGVWLSNVPLDINEGAVGDVLLKVSLDVSETEISDYEWVEELKPYREWLAPAELVNAKGSVTVCSEQEEDALTEQRWADWSDD